MRLTKRAFIPKNYVRMYTHVYIQWTFSWNRCFWVYTQKRSFWRERQFVAVTKEDICHFDIEAIAHSIVKQGHVDAVKQMNALKLQQAQPVT